MILFGVFLLISFTMPTISYDILACDLSWLLVCSVSSRIVSLCFAMN